MNKKIEKTTYPASGKLSLQEWFAYIANQSRKREGIESVRVRRQYD